MSGSTNTLMYYFNMTEIFIGTRLMLTIVVFVSLIVFVAMAIDCISGWRKATLRGEEHRSYLLARSLTKFLLYEGGIIIATCIDLLIYIAKFWVLFGLDVINGIPIVCCLVGIFLCIVEGKSVYEKADEKDKNKFREAGVMVGSVLENEKVADLVLDMLAERMKKRKEEEPC